MASLFKRQASGQASAFWWVRFKDLGTGKWKSKATPYRTSVNTETRLARTYAAELTLAERKGDEVRGNWNWVQEFLQERYEGKPKTLHRYTIAWRTISLWLARQGIHAPAALTYNHIQPFVEWRKTYTGDGVWKCGHNNAVLEVKILGLLMKEAMRRGLCQGNPCAGSGLHKRKPPEKPEITDDEIQQIRTALKTEPEWMAVAFEIAIHQGCRLRETAIPLKLINIRKGGKSTITFPVTKGDKPFTTALHTDLIPLVKRLRAEGKTVTCEIPPMASKAWWLFFRRQKLRHLCFHCTRVTVITRLARAGVPMAQAMAFVNHASETVHRVYQRLKPADVGAALSALRGIGPPQS